MLKLWTCFYLHYTAVYNSGSHTEFKGIVSDRDANYRVVSSALETETEVSRTTSLNNPNVTVSVHVSTYRVYHSQRDGEADGSIAGGKKQVLAQ